MINSKTKINLILVFFCLLFATFIRAYNIGYDDLWFDEISSFWVSDPEISFKESFIRHNNIEKTPFLYFAILKINFELFSYNSVVGRGLSLFFNILGIIFSVLICKNLRNNSSYILSLFIFSTNIFLINYSQELRVYSLVFFLTSLYLFLFININKFYKNEFLNFPYFFFISLVLLIMLLSHPFCLIVFFSTSLFILFEFIYKKKISKTLVYSSYFGIVVSLIIIFFIIIDADSAPTWIIQPDIKFYTNFYFSKFFGSRLMGLIHLILLLSLIALIFKKTVKKIFELNIFLLIIFLSYFLPIVYGYIIAPVIFPRYIIFILTPIIILLSILIFDINNTFIKRVTISLVVVMNLGNLFFEATFQQFYKTRPFFKPNFTEMINVLKNDEVKLYTIELSSAKSNNNYYDDAIKNYISHFQIYKNSNIEYLEKKNFLNSNKDKIWVLCLINIDKDNCNKIKLNPNDNILSEKAIPGMRMALISKN